MERYDYGFIGGGNMALAMAKGLARSGAATMAIAEPDERRRDELARLLPAAMIDSDNGTVAAASATVILAVKPDLVAGVCGEIARAASLDDKTVVSIAAGVRSEVIQGSLGARGAVVRAMPNQPALLGLGMTTLFTRSPLTPEQRIAVEQLTAAAGEYLWLADEAMMDGATAVAGSGPAYVYLLLEMLEDAAVAFGFDPAEARLLAETTVAGAAAVAAHESDPPAELRARVTSPGGTTAAAIRTLEAADIRGIFRSALTAARDRGRELSLTPEDDQ